MATVPAGMEQAAATCGALERPSRVLACMVGAGKQSTNADVRQTALAAEQQAITFGGRASLFASDGVWFVRKHWPWFLGGLAVAGAGIYLWRGSKR